MAKYILLINIHSSDNAGDAALTRVTLDQLKQYFPGFGVTLSMDDAHSHVGWERVVGSIFTWVKGSDSENRSYWKIWNLLCVLPVSLFQLLFWRITKRTASWLIPRGLRAIIQAYLDADLVVSKPGGFL